MTYSEPAELHDLPDAAVRLAAEILSASRANETSAERNRSAMMARMMNDPNGKKFTIAMADQVLRMHTPRRAARRMDSLVEEFGVPKYFAATDRLALSVGNEFASLMPSVVMPQVKAKVRSDSEHVIISAEEKEFKEYLEQRKKSGIRVNFNQLGEAVLGAKEAERRLHDNIRRLREPGVNYISVKLSAIFSQINLVGYQQTIEQLKPRLRSLYQAAIEGSRHAGTTTNAEGNSVPITKFVNLDMEEYRDLRLTVDVFTAVLDEPEFDQFSAGIVLQAYLPDSFEVLQSLTAWARARFERTGTDIKIRLVKGANLAMETVEASLRDWELATFPTKLEVDANFKRMLEFAARPENARAVRIGVGSHNLFDIAYALLLRQRRGVAERIEFEMLEGMANAQATEIKQRSGDCLVYAPVVLDAEFESAVAYLVRRLDENTAPGSFLGALFSLKEGSPAWTDQRDAFLAACKLAQNPALISAPRRQQNRLTEQIQIQHAFHNVADTDFALPANREWANQIFEAWQNKTLDPIPLQVAGEFRSQNISGSAKDPSRPNHVAYQFAQANAADVEDALATAVAAVADWDKAGIEQRTKVLKQAGVKFAEARGDTIGAMLLDAGKNIVQADVEVSEAIDFANYYAHGLSDPGFIDGTQHAALGVIVVTPPWNFPYAIPAGGVLAALAAGNSVILKPARETVLVAWKLVNQLWDAGVPKNVLQFVPTVDGETGKALVSDERVAAVILTGSIFTAKLFQSWRPDLKLFAETSGKNAMIVTAAADIDLAIKDIVYGAFGHAGQKCSATSLALIEKEVYDNPKFFLQLKDAAESLKVAGSWDPSAAITPIQRPPDAALMKGLTELEPGESWLLEPQMIDNNPCLWRPGIRIGVRPGCWYHQTECFGPVLGIMRVNTFEDALKIQNSSEFGLTGGLHSLDPHEVDMWREKVEVGNAYINRSTTGAIVRRQPFGGWKDSCVGPGPKAGGPNYVAAFCRWDEIDSPTRSASLSKGAQVATRAVLGLLNDQTLKAQLLAAAGSYAYWWQHEFSISHDPSQIHGETNEFRYRRRPWHVLRLLNPLEAEFQMPILKTVLACATAGVPLIISTLKHTLWLENLCDSVRVEYHVESAEPLARRMSTMRGGTLRLLGDYDAHQYGPLIIGNIPVVSPNVYSNGRLELLNYLREQSMTETVHRYGNII